LSQEAVEVTTVITPSRVTLTGYDMNTDEINDGFLYGHVVREILQLPDQQRPVYRMMYSRWPSGAASPGEIPGEI